MAFSKRSMSKYLNSGCMACGATPSYIFDVSGSLCCSRIVLRRVDVNSVSKDLGQFHIQSAQILTDCG